jgi:hypothetical protein
MRTTMVTRLALATALGAASSGSRADLAATRMLQESLAVDRSRPLLVIVDNVFGSIRVTGEERGSVEMTATETIRGDLQADIDRARREVELRIEHEDGRAAFRVRRVGESGDCECGRWQDYVVEYEIELRVPQDAAIELETVNGGDIEVVGVRGDVDVRNVNGGVNLAGLRGSGRAATVNGELDARFERAPARATSFKTVNGEIDVEFPRDLAADLEFKTMHGEVYTGFDAEPVVGEPTTERRRDGGAVVIRTARASRVRVGSGGPTHSFETINGDVYVREGGR